LERVNGYLRDDRRLTEAPDSENTHVPAPRLLSVFLKSKHLQEQQKPQSHVFLLFYKIPQI
jgi:hypothetical protein